MPAIINPKKLKKENMKIAVIGTGYVGLVGGTCFAESGNDVLCVDNNQEKLAKLRAGAITIYEPGLEVLFERNNKEGRLSFTDSVEEAVAYAEIIFLALPTPPMEDGSADLQYVLAVAEQIGKCIKDYRVIVNKSTVPVGTADKVRDKINEFTNVEFDVVSNPEFLREGAAVNDFMKPDRVVVGTRSERARKLMEKLYKPFVMSGNPIIFMDERSSELTKYAANSLLATKISFMNEIANLCERVGADVDRVRAGVGYGGSCFPKDVSALYKTSKAYGYDFKILDAVMTVNDKQKHVMVDKLETYYGSDFSKLTFAVWGLAFKPNTDDIREAPALTIIAEMLKRGAKVKAYDPEAMWQVKNYTDLDIEMVEHRYAALEGADALCVVTEWSEFRTPDFDKIKGLLKKPVVFDGRNIFDMDQMAELGFYYNSIGRGVVNALQSNTVNS